MLVWEQFNDNLIFKKRRVELSKGHLNQKNLKKRIHWHWLIVCAIHQNLRTSLVVHLAITSYGGYGVLIRPAGNYHFLCWQTRTISTDVLIKDSIQKSYNRNFVWVFTFSYWQCTIILSEHWDLFSTRRRCSLPRAIGIEIELFKCQGSCSQGIIMHDPKIST